MNPGETYYQQVQLLVDILPLVAEEKCFALKGGTAINLFIRDMPRPLCAGSCKIWQKCQQLAMRRQWINWRGY